jgi:hypothetical protein
MTPMELSAVSTPSESEQDSNYEIRIQSVQLSGAIPLPKGCDIGPFLTKDTANRVCRAGDNLVFKIFPDEAFGFSINENFAQNFHGIFLSAGGTLDPKNFPNESATAVFLNRIISTIASFLHTTGQNHIKPLRYFSALHASVCVHGEVDRKPDIVLVRLIHESDSSYTREGRLEWKDIQALVEHTISKEVPKRMPKTITDKNYLMFCDQPERNFIINLCITGSGCHVVVSDHAGQIDTDLISFSQPSTTLLFLRMVMGLAFLPDKWLGIDDTIIRRVHGQKPSTKFDSAYPALKCTFDNPKITVICSPALNMQRPFAITTDPAKEDECSEFDTIAIGDTTYKVLKIIFQSPAFIGRATKAFLVEIGDGRQGVLKDSFIMIDRCTEESILNGLTIPFGPDIVDHCILGDTSAFRTSLLRPAALLETRQKRRILTYPAGVHISDFNSLWELMVVFLDVAVGTSYLVTNSLCVPLPTFL